MYLLETFCSSKAGTNSVSACLGTAKQQKFPLSTWSLFHNLHAIKVCPTF